MPQKLCLDSRGDARNCLQLYTEHPSDTISPKQPKQIYMVACDLPRGRVEKVLLVQFCHLIEIWVHLEKLISTMIYSSIFIHVLCVALQYNEIWFSSLPLPPINVSLLFMFCVDVTEQKKACSSHFKATKWLQLA